MQVTDRALSLIAWLRDIDLAGPKIAMTAERRR
jgi:hypothetical protein